MNEACARHEFGLLSVAPTPAEQGGVQEHVESEILEDGGPRPSPAFRWLNPTIFFLTAAAPLLAVAMPDAQHTAGDPKSAAVRSTTPSVPRPATHAQGLMNTHATWSRRPASLGYGNRDGCSQ